jgi:hypothetical protein
MQCESGRWGGRLYVDMVVICGAYEVPVSIYFASEVRSLNGPLLQLAEL